MTGFLPVISALEGTFGIDEDVSDILGIPYLVVSFADLKKRITDYLADQRREQKTDAFVKDLKARAKIEIL